MNLIQLNSIPAFVPMPKCCISQQLKIADDLLKRFPDYETLQMSKLLKFQPHIFHQLFGDDDWSVWIIIIEYVKYHEKL